MSRQRSSESCMAVGPVKCRNLSVSAPAISYTPFGGHGHSSPTVLANGRYAPREPSELSALLRISTCRSSQPFWAIDVREVQCFARLDRGGRQARQARATIHRWASNAAGSRWMPCWGWRNEKRSKLSRLMGSGRIVMAAKRGDCNTDIICRALDVLPRVGRGGRRVTGGRPGVRVRPCYPACWICGNSSLA